MSSQSTQDANDLQHFMYMTADAFWIGDNNGGGLRSVMPSLGAQIATFARGPFDVMNAITSGATSYVTGNATMAEASGWVFFGIGLIAVAVMAYILLKGGLYIGQSIP